MDISSVLAAVLRRWYVSVLVMAVVAFGAQQLWQDSRPQYTASTTLAVLPSQALMNARSEAQAGESSLGNPYGVQAQGTLAVLLSDNINNGLIDVPEGTQVAVEAGDQDVQSVFTVVAVGDTPAGPAAALQAVVEQSPQVLAVLQTTAGSPDDQVYTTQQGRPVSDPTESYPDRQRAVLGVVLAGLLVAALASVLVDSLLRAASRRRRASKSAQQTALVDVSESEPAAPSVQRGPERRFSERRAASQAEAGAAPDAEDPSQTSLVAVHGRREQLGATNRRT